LVPQQFRTFHCPCGARRDVGIGIRFLGCVKCGRAMIPATLLPLAAPPGRALLASAMFATQLLGALVFALAFVWITKHHGDWPTNVAILCAGAIGVFAGGKAHRGSVRALGVAAVFDLGVATAFTCYGHVAAIKTFVVTPVAWVAPALLPMLSTIVMIAALIAVCAAAACIAAVPQTRRFAEWRYEQVLHAVRSWGGATPR